MKYLRLLLIPLAFLWYQGFTELPNYAIRSQIQGFRIEEAAASADIRQLKESKESIDKKIELKTNHLTFLQNKRKSLECALSWCEIATPDDPKVEIECTNWETSRWDSATEDAIGEMVDQKDQCSVFNEQSYCLRSEKRQASCRRI